MPLAAQLDEMRALQRRFGEENPVVRNDADGGAPEAREPGHQRRPVVLLEFVQLASVDDARDRLTHVVGLAFVLGDDTVELCGGIERLHRLAHVQVRALRPVEVGDDTADDGEGMRVVLRRMIGDAGLPGMHFGSAKFLRRHDLSGRGLDQRRTSQKDRAVSLDDDALVGHRRNVGAARRARAHHRRDLRDARGRHRRLVVEDASEVLAVRKDAVLLREEGAARVDQIDARKAVLQGDLLRAQVLLHRDRVVGPAFDGGVVHDDHTLARRHTSRRRRAGRARGTASPGRAGAAAARAAGACRGRGAWRAPPPRHLGRRARPWHVGPRRAQPSRPHSPEIPPSPGSACS